MGHHAPASVRYVYLRGAEELIRQRLASRTGHFMNPLLLHSQFETLEPPENAVVVDITPRPQPWCVRSGVNSTSDVKFCSEGTAGLLGSSNGSGGRW